MGYVPIKRASPLNAVENLNRLQTGRGEIAFTPGESLSDAWNGNEDAGFRHRAQWAIFAAAASIAKASPMTIGWDQSVE